MSKHHFENRVVFVVSYFCLNDDCFAESNFLSFEEAMNFKSSLETSDKYCLIEFHVDICEILI